MGPGICFQLLSGLRRRLAHGDVALHTDSASPGRKGKKKKNTALCEARGKDPLVNTADRHCCRHLCYTTKVFFFLYLSIKLLFLYVIGKQHSDLG